MVMGGGGDVYVRDGNIRFNSAVIAACLSLMCLVFERVAYDVVVTGSNSGVYPLFAILT